MVMKNCFVPCFFLFFTGMLVAQPNYDFYQYEVNFAEAGKPHSIYWNNTGFTPGDLLFEKDLLLTLDYFSAIPNAANNSYIRPHWLLNLVGSENAGTKDAVYNFEKLDRALDELVSRELLLVFEIMGFPNLSWHVPQNKYGKGAQSQKNKAQQWQPDFENEEELVLWYDFVRALVLHLEERYGEETLKSWYFECTNEPDIGSFWGRGIPALLNYWDATSEAIKSVNPDYQFGGPGTARGLTDELKAVLAHCDTGMNAITGERGAVLDFISIHRKFLPYIMVDKEMSSIAYIREHHPRYKNTPFWNDEADPTWGWNQSYWWRAHPWHASFVALSVDAHNRLLVDSLGVNFGMLINDHAFLGDWYRRTLMARYLNPENPDMFWLFKKPVHSVKTMLSIGQGKRYEVKGYPSTRENVVVIPSKAETGEVVVLLVNQPDFGVIYDNRKQNTDIPYYQKSVHDQQGASVHLSLKNMGFDQPVLMQVQLDALHGYAHGAWKSIGKPDTITSAIYRTIAAHMDPVVVAEGLEMDMENLHVVLPPSSVTMLVIREKTDENLIFEEPAIREVKKYSGYNGERKNFVRWEQETQAVVRYNVYASYDGGAYERINPYPLFDLGYLDVLPESVDEARYKIEVVY